VRLGSRDCVVCGQANPIGMRLQFEVDGQGAAAQWTVTAPFQGFRDVLQGGMICAILDDCMWYAAYGQGGVTLTAEATVRYLARVPVGARVLGRGRVVGRHGRLWTCAATLERPDGQVLASAQGKFLQVPEPELSALLAGTAVHELPAPAQPGPAP